jgi:hypothetical protein
MAMTIEDILAWSLEQIECGQLRPQDCLRRFPDQRAELEELLETVSRLRAIPVGLPSHAFRSRARRELSARIRLTRRQRFCAPRSSRPVAPSRALPGAARRAWSLAAAFVTVVAMSVTTSGALAASDSLPGDWLYPAKLMMEQAQEALTFQAEAQAALHLRLAERRMDEIAALIEASRIDDIDQALSGLDLELALITLDQDGAAARGLGVGEIPSGFTHHLEVLTELMARVPDAARPALERVVARAMTTIENGGPGRSGQVPPGQAGLPGQGSDQGNAGAAPGQSDDHGNAGTPPGQSDDHGNAGTPPGQSGDQGNSGTPPGQSGDHGNSGTPPGQSGEHGKPDSPPGRDK